MTGTRIGPAAPWRSVLVHRRAGTLPPPLLLAAICLAAAGCARPVTVGAVVSETGAAAFYGAKVRKGLALALDEVNASRRLGQPKIRLVVEDDATNPDVGQQATRDLIERQGARIVIGAVSSAVTLKIAPLCEKSHTILLSPTGSAPGITTAGDYIFRNYPSDVLEGTSMADFARDLGLASVAILAVDDEFGTGLARVFAERFRGGGREVTRTLPFKEGEVAALGPTIADLASHPPDGIYAVGYVSDVAALLRAIRGAKIGSVVLSASSVTEQVVGMAGTAAENLVYPEASFDPDSAEPASRAFVEAYRARYHEAPDTFAAHAYDALELIVLAMDRAGSSDPDAVRKALLGIDDYVGASGPTAFDENGDVVQYPRLLIVRRGRPEPYDRFVEEGGSLRAAGKR